jgi:hypothetical protein
MENEKKNSNDKGIDEQYLMSMMAGSQKKELPNQNSDFPTEKEVPKHKVKSKKTRMSAMWNSS